MFKSKREALLEELVDELKGKIARIEKGTPKQHFVHVKVPDQNDEDAYLTVVGMLGDSPLLLFYFSMLQNAVFSGISSGKEPQDYYRGQMQLISMILDDSRRAREKLSSGGVEDEV